MAVEKHFYGGDENAEADDVITGVETQLANFTSYLRRMDILKPFDPKKAAELTVHLAMRNRNAREDLISAAESFADQFEEKISEVTVLKRVVKDYFRDNPKEVERLFRKNALQGKQLPRHQYQQLLALHRIQLPSLIDNASESALKEIAKSIGLLKSYLRTSMVSGHNKALASNPTPEKRIERLQHLDWNVFEYPPGSLILGDFGPWAKCEGEHVVRPLFYALKELEQIALPISDCRLLAGTNAGGGGALDSLTVNSNSASISGDFFVGSVRAAEFETLVALIGTVKPDELDEAVNNAIHTL